MGAKDAIDRLISVDRAKQLLVGLVRVPSPQTDLFEAEPLLREFIATAVEPRLREAGIENIRYDGMGNLISTYGADVSGKSLMRAPQASAMALAMAGAGSVIDFWPMPRTLYSPCPSVESSTIVRTRGMSPIEGIL